MLSSTDGELNKIIDLQDQETIGVKTKCGPVSEETATRMSDLQTRKDRDDQICDDKYLALERLEIDKVQNLMTNIDQEVVKYKYQVNARLQGRLTEIRKAHTVAKRNIGTDQWMLQQKINLELHGATTMMKGMSTSRQLQFGCEMQDLSEQRSLYIAVVLSDFTLILNHINQAYKIPIVEQFSRNYGPGTLRSSVDVKIEQETGINRHVSFDLEAKPVDHSGPYRDQPCSSTSSIEEQPVEAEMAVDQVQTDEPDISGRREHEQTMERHAQVTIPPSPESERSGDWLRAGEKQQHLDTATQKRVKILVWRWQT